MFKDLGSNPFSVTEEEYLSVVALAENVKTGTAEGHGNSKIWTGIGSADAAKLFYGEQ